MSAATASGPLSAPSSGTEVPKKRRGRENVRDMLLSMAVCVAVIVPVWYLGQPAPSDSQALRVVDTTADVQAFRAAAPGVPVPGDLPEGWRPTSSTLEGDRLRIGYVTPDDGYVEYAAKAGEPEAFVDDQTGRGERGGSLTVGDRVFAVYSDGDGHTSLVQEGQAGTVVLGGLREAAEDEEITELASSLR